MKELCLDSFFPCGGSHPWDWVSVQIADWSYCLQSWLFCDNGGARLLLRGGPVVMTTDPVSSSMMLTLQSELGKPFVLHFLETCQYPFPAEFHGTSGQTVELLSPRTPVTHLTFTRTGMNWPNTLGLGCIPDWCWVCRREGWGRRLKLLRFSNIVSLIFVECFLFVKVLVYGYTF